MAKKKNPEIDKNKLYKISLKNKTIVLERTLYPGKTYFVKGDILETLLEKGVVSEWVEN
jgi:tRNA A37 threonylcarbamoyladenosine biosynthesis protein TsaE